MTDENYRICSSCDELRTYRIYSYRDNDRISVCFPRRITQIQTRFVAYNQLFVLPSRNHQILINLLIVNSFRYGVGTRYNRAVTNTWYLFTINTKLVRVEYTCWNTKFTFYN